jgi:hypothetical protein
LKKEKTSERNNKKCGNKILREIVREKEKTWEENLGK